MKHLTLLLALLIALPAFSQRSKSKTEEVQPVILSEGIPYTLPRTGIRIVVHATRTDFIPGPYAQYADRLLGIKGVSTQPQSFWQIEKVSFGSFAEPDPECYFITDPRNTPFIQLTPDGCLAGFNADPAATKPATPSTNFFDQGNQIPAVRYTTLINTPGLSGETPAGERAVKAAELILKTRAARFDISAGLLDEFHPDGKAYEESLRQLEKIEKENLELFTGEKTSDKLTFVYDFLPPSKTVKGEVIFRFDEKLGFLSSADFSGKPVFIDVEKDESLPVKVISSVPTVPSVDKKTGIYQRLPGMANIKLTKELTVIGTTRMTIAQFGLVSPIPAELLNGGFSIGLHPETGAVRTISKK